MRCDTPALFDGSLQHVSGVVDKYIKPSDSANNLVNGSLHLLVFGQDVKTPRNDLAFALRLRAQVGELGRISGRGDDRVASLGRGQGNFPTEAGRAAGD